MPKLTHSPLNNILITSPEGIRIHPIYKEVKNHDGIDLDAVKNTPVFATHPGKVINVGNSVDKNGYGYGNYIVLYDEATDTVTLYAHLNSINVSLGQVITADQANSDNGFKIGLSGQTGTKKPHLHFEVMQGSQLLPNGKITIAEAITTAGKNNGSGVGIASSQNTKSPSYAAPRLKASEYLKKISAVSLSHKVPTLDAQYNIDFYGNIDPLSRVNNQLFISNKPLSGTALSLTNKNTNEVIPNIWKLKTSDDAEYVVSCLDNNNKISSNGTKLLINPLGATNTENCIIINNFPFSESIKSAEEATKNNGVSTTVAPFGIKLSKNNQIDFSKIEFNQLSRSVGDIGSSAVNDNKIFSRKITKSIRKIILSLTILLMVSLITIDATQAKEIKKEQVQNKQVVTEYKSELVDKIIKAYKLDPKNNPKDQCELVNRLIVLTNHLSLKLYYKKLGKNMPDIDYDGTSPDRVEMEIEKIKRETNIPKISVSCGACFKNNYGCNGSFIYAGSDMLPNSACPINDEIFIKRFAAYHNGIEPDIITPGDVFNFDFITLLFDKYGSGIGYVYNSENKDEEIDYGKERFYSFQKNSERNFDVVDKNHPNINLITKGCYITYSNLK